MKVKNLSEIITNAKNNNLEAIEYLCKHYSKTIDKIVNYYSNTYDLGILNEEDLRQVCYIGLIKCLQSKSSFTHILYYYMTNECRRELFNNHSSIRIPMHVYERDMNRAISLRDSFEPIDIDEVDTTEYINYIGYSDDYLVDDIYNKTILDTIKPILTKREFNILYLKFYEDMSFRQIGKIHNISGNRASQILIRTLNKIRRSKVL